MTEGVRIEELSPAKKELLALERTGQYVFHGSDYDGSIFVPQQAHNYKEGRHIPDGPPAIFASSVVDYAIFMAILCKKNCSMGYRSGVDSRMGRLKFRATQKTLDQLTDVASGTVYVFNKSDFALRKGRSAEYAALDVAIPLKRITVTKRDLPQDIEIIPEGS